MYAFPFSVGGSGVKFMVDGIVRRSVGTVCKLKWVSGTMEQMRVLTSRSKCFMMMGVSATGR